MLEAGKAIICGITLIKATNSEFVKSNKCLLKYLADLKADLGRVNIEKNIYSDVQIMVFPGFLDPSRIIRGEWDFELMSRVSPE